MARDAASWYVEQLNLALAPLSMMSAIVRHKPQHADARDLFLPLAPSLFSQVRHFLYRTFFVPYISIRTCSSSEHGNGRPSGGQVGSSGARRLSRAGSLDRAPPKGQRVRCTVSCYVAWLGCAALWGLLSREVRA